MKADEDLRTTHLYLYIYPPRKIYICIYLYIYICMYMCIYRRYMLLHIDGR